MSEPRNKYGSGPAEQRPTNTRFGTGELVANPYADWKTRSKYAVGPPRWMLDQDFRGTVLDQRIVRIAEVHHPGDPDMPAKR